MNKQSHIYHYLGIETDPVFKKITNLKKGESVNLLDIKVKLNSNNFYEIETTYKHECFSSQKQVYDSISNLLSLIVLKGND